MKRMEKSVKGEKNILYGVAAVVIMAAVSAVMIFSSAGSEAVSRPGTPKDFMVSSARGAAVLTWEKVRGADRYIVYQAKSGKSFSARKIRQLRFRKERITKKRKAVIKGLKKGMDYHYYVVAVKKTRKGKVKGNRTAIRSTTIAAKGKSTLKNLLRTGLAPVGNTLYVWGGGWNRPDNGTGKTAKTNGLWPSWKVFYKENKNNYNYRNHRYKIFKGLDCSGFIGWTVYNIFEKKNGKDGYVTWAVNQGKWFARRGFGKYSPSGSFSNFKAGDIMTCATHVWMCVGQCRDGSAVILHASPPAISLAGTPSKSGKKNSMAVRLARRYMKKYYGSLFAMDHSMVVRGMDYRTNYGRMRWNTKTLSDPEGYRKMTADKVLKDLFAEREKN